ncbi:MAG: glycosyltransferase family 4 protein [Desulfovibrio sp.]|nr:glycosyltransferase family 4 protein [Desulfovibrio sp.]
MKVVVLGNQARSVYNFWSVLMRKLMEKGHDVLCLVPDPPCSKAEDIDALRSRCTQLLTYQLERKGLNPWCDLLTCRELYEIFREEQPKLIFSSTIKPVIYGSLAAHWAKVPHCYATITGLGYTFENDSLIKRCLNKLSVFLYKIALARAEGIFFQNADDVEVFRKSGILRPTSRVLMARGTGVDTKHFAASPYVVPPTLGELNFLLVGRLLSAKGLREYASAAREVLRDFPKARFQLLGPAETGPGGVPLDEVRAWEQEGLLEYLGETNDVRPYLANCHVLVLPSWREGTPTAVMEAMSTGRACIVTDVPGCREVVIDGDNGRIVPAHDPKALASAMRFFLTEPKAVVSMGMRGRELALQLFDAEVVAEQILKDMHID